MAVDDVDDEDGSLGYYRRLQVVVEGILISRGLVSAEDIAKELKSIDERDYSRGAKVVARAWCDPLYRQRLIQDASAAVRELGFEIGPLKLIIVANTPTLHNLIVCTLCSCYPRGLLGTPPHWYKSVEYRSAAVRTPRELLSQFGTKIQDNVRIRVHDSTADMRYMVLPLRPRGTEKLTEEELQRLVTRDSLIGVGLALPA